MWDVGAMTVQDVHKALTGQVNTRALAYTTVLTVMRNLARRKILSQEPSGRKHIFKPLISRDEYKKGSVAQLCTDLFAGDSEQLIAFIKSCQAP